MHIKVGKGRGTRSLMNSRTATTFVSNLSKAIVEKFFNALGRKEVKVAKISAIYTRRGGCKQQSSHMDFQLGAGVCGIVFAIGEGVRWIDKEGTEQEILQGQGIVFDANYTHAGAAYVCNGGGRHPQHLRLHAYVVHRNEPDYNLQRNAENVFYETLHQESKCICSLYQCNCSKYVK